MWGGMVRMRRLVLVAAPLYVVTAPVWVPVLTVVVFNANRCDP